MTPFLTVIAILYLPVGIGLRNVLAAYLAEDRPLTLKDSAMVVLCWPIYAVFCAVYPPPK